MKITPELLRAYNNTLAKAITHVKSDFQCGGLGCENCPFKYSDCCDVNVKGGGGELRTFDEWKQWFADLFETTDNRSVNAVVEELRLSKQPGTDGEPEPVEFVYQVTRTTLSVAAPVERKVFRFEQVIAELSEFMKDITTWVQLMHGKASDISIIIPDYMEFHAVDAKGYSVLDWAMDAGDFGKKKVWTDA